jgi:hypothetical protein
MSRRTSPSTHPDGPVVETMEPRLLFSADIAPLALAMSAMPHLGAHAQSLAPAQAAVHAASQGTPSEWVFIDAGVPDLQSFLKDFEQQAKQGRALNVVVIKAGEDGVSRISQALADQQHVGAIHIISHGSEGAVQLGTVTLDAQVLRQRADELAQWGAALSDNADLLLYGCDVAAHAKGQAFMQDLAALTGADVAASTDVTGAGGNWMLERSTGQIDTAMAVSAPWAEQWTGQLAQATPISKGLAVWSDASGGIPKASQWDGLANGPSLPTAATNNWTIITSASAPDGRSAIVLGVDANGVIQGERWTGTAWESLPALTLVSPTSSVRQGFAVAYEQDSRDAMVVWSDGAKLQYTTYKGQGWSPAAAVDTYAGSVPQRLQIAAQPRGNQLLLTISDDNFHDRALTWDGDSWGPEVILDANGGTAAQQLALSPVYETQSGNAMVVYGKAGDNLIYYRVFDNNPNIKAWSPEKSVSLGLSGSPMTIVTAADANSDRIGLGVMSMVGNSSNVHETFATWNGSAWEAVTQITGNPTFSGTTVSVAFESKSGDLLAAYLGGGNSPGLLTLAANATTWSSAIAGPDMGSSIGAIRLFADPATDHIMLGVQATSGKLTYAEWDGQALKTSSALTIANTNSAFTPAFTWIWQPQNDNTANTGLWLGSAVDSTGWPGLVQVYDKEILSLDSQGLTLGANASKGTLSHVWNAATFGVPSLDDMVWVSQPVSLLSGASFRRGDILFTVGSSTTLQGTTSSVAVNNNDVVLFRPTKAGDYSSGEFTKVFSGLGAGVNGTNSTPDIRGLALVERDVIIGERQLRAGDFLFTAGGAGNSRDIYVQTYSTAGFVLLSNTTKLLAGNDLGISNGIAALEVITVATTIGGQSLSKGELLITLDGADTIGNNNLAVEKRDIVRLSLSRTSVNATALGNATLLLDGSAMGTPSVTLDGLALIHDVAPVITSGTGDTFEVSVAENQQTVTTVKAQDSKGGSNVSYAIGGGADATLFTIDASGNLKFKSQNVPDYEVRADANQDGVYEVVVTASEGSLADEQRILVTLTDVNEAPVMDSSTLNITATELRPASLTLATITAADPESQALSYSISGGADASYFQIDSSTGELRFKNTPDTLAAPFLNHALTYAVQVAASDGTFTATRNVGVTLIKVNRPPVNTLPGPQNTLEDTPLALQGLAVTDPDAGLANLTVTFSASAGTLSLNTQVSNGVQVSQVQIIDGGKTLIIQASSAAINTTLADSAGLSYLSDKDAYGVFTLTMVSDDGGQSGVPQQPEQRTDTDTINIRVEAVNDTPSLDKNLALSVNEGESATLSKAILRVVDVDNDASELRYSLSTPPSHGHLALAQTPQIALSGQGAFTQAQIDAGEVIYVHDGSESLLDSLQLRVSDGEGGVLPDITIQINITQVNDAPVMGNSTLSITATELSPAATVLATITATDPDSQSLSYSISGGVDASFFQIDSNTGDLRFIDTPNTKDAAFAGHALSYDLEVAANDGALTATQHVVVTLNKVNRPPLNTLPAQQDALEDTALVLTGLSVQDEDAGLANLTVSFSVSAGTLSLNTQVNNGVQASQVQVLDGGKTVLIQASSVAINATLADSAGLTYLSAKDAFGVFTLTMVSDDGGSSGAPQQPEQRTDTDTIDIKVTAVNDTPSLDKNLALSVTEGESATLSKAILRVVDVDNASSELRYSLITLPGHGHLALAQTPQIALTGQGTFTQAQIDAGEVIYVHDGSETKLDSLQLRVSDGEGAAPPDITVQINITSVNDAPVLENLSSLQLLQGQSVTLTSTQLAFEDADTPPDQLTYSITQGAAHGHLALRGSPEVALTGANAFTQAQVNAGQIIYVHDGSDTLADALTLSLSDGQAPPIENITLSVQLSPVPAPPTAVEPPSNEPVSVRPLLAASPDATQGEARDNAQPADAQVSNANASPPASAAANELMSSQQRRVAVVYTPPLQSLSDTLASMSLQPGIALPQVLPPKPTELKESAEEQTTFTFRWTGSLQAGQATQELSRTLAALRDTLTDGDEGHQHPLMTSSIAVSTGLSVGYVIWLVRGGALLGSMLSSMPLWNMVDPLPVLSRSNAGSRPEDATEDGDSPLENLFDGRGAPPKPTPAPTPASPPALAQATAATASLAPHDGQKGAS